MRNLRNQNCTRGIKESPRGITGIKTMDTRNQRNHFKESRNQNRGHEESVRNQLGIKRNQNRGHGGISLGIKRNRQESSGIARNQQESAGINRNQAWTRGIS